MKKALLFLGLLGTIPATAQQDISLFALNNVFQQLYVNPSYLPKSKVHVGLPIVSSVYARLSNTGYSIGELVQTPGNGEFDTEKFLKGMNDRNITALDFSTDLLSIGIRYNNMYFSFSATEKLSTNLVYRKDFFTLIFKGNGEELLGKRADFNGTEYNLNLYHEYALGVSAPIGEKARIGVRAKYLMGTLNATTVTSRLGFTTAEDNYTLTLDGSLALNTAGFSKLENTNDDLDQLATDVLFKPGGNSGLALDAGADYYLTDRINLSASLLNLGYIRWRGDIKNYVNDSIFYQFSGVPMQSFNKEFFTKEIAARLDTLQEKLEFDTNDNAYSARLNPQMILAGTFTLNDYSSIGAMLRSELISTVVRPSLTFFWQFKISNWIGATVNYSYLNRSFVNLGAGFVIKFFPLQFYITSDNVLAPLAINTAKGSSLRTGLNLAFGGKEVKRLRIPEFEEE